ncbi:hypothetical protein B5S31_g1353 [[Candida] boidinii]|uniref:Unnamed protein product n=1 Tax=Candida boidinii TaxID=5477 RepID=A0ACB5TJN8_CANBO|nr:hypothetical protein B5S29_g4096 [[Candida] boidinii]OWB71662.1 hypothetical protein B5S31_g1353 [[Candida] boidinii]GME89525.1 unnamed protein product [[Candida] boidinii]
MASKEEQFEEAKRKAIELYDVEHTLEQDERVKVAEFFESNFRASVFTSGFGFLGGISLPFIFKKKGKIINPIAPIFCGFILSSFLTSTVSSFFFNSSLSSAKDKYGETSKIFQVITKSPDPVLQSFFWAAYYRKSSENPELRMRNPRDITDMNQPLVFNRPKQIKNGVPGFDETNQSNNNSITNSPQVIDAWDRVRKEQDPLHVQERKDYKYYNEQLEQQKDKQQNSQYDSPFEDEQQQKQQEQGDSSYSPFDVNLGNSNSDQLNQPINGSAWDRIRQQRKD